MNGPPRKKAAPEAAKQSGAGQRTARPVYVPQTGTQPQTRQRRELTFREICKIMGRNLRIITPNEQQLELFDAASAEGQ